MMARDDRELFAIAERQFGNERRKLTRDCPCASRVAERRGYSIHVLCAEGKNGRGCGFGVIYPVSVLEQFRRAVA